MPLHNMDNISHLFTRGVWGLYLVSLEQLEGSSETLVHTTSFPCCQRPCTNKTNSDAKVFRRRARDLSVLVLAGGSSL